ncbi:hypothetical protein L916_18734 [Phytophthora nicotianae]|nr:hypothetical protein L916_18734 [Phytophthora nicotianae]
MITTGRVAVFATDNSALCRAKQFQNLLGRVRKKPKSLRAMFCYRPAISCLGRNPPPDDQDSPLLGEALMVREQRARAAQPYHNMVALVCIADVIRECAVLVRALE